MKTLRVLFLGNDYNPLSIACARAICETSHEPMIGVFVPGQGNLVRTAVRAWQRFGPAFVIRRGFDLLRAQARRLIFRGSGVNSVSSLRELARQRGLPLVSCQRVNSSETVAHLARFEPDLILIGGFSQILKRRVIELPRIACLNVHPSLLPAYRGPNPLYWVLERGERQTGVTIHHVDEVIDAGDIVLQQPFSIEAGDSEVDLLRRAAMLSADLVKRVVMQASSGPLPRQPQDAAAASYYSHPPRGRSRL